MSNKALRTYLNIPSPDPSRHWNCWTISPISTHPERKQFFTGLYAEVEEDQKVLQRLLEQVGGEESTVRKAAAWLTEKFGQGKLHLADLGDGQLRVLEALETVGSDRVPRLRGVDFTRLEQRAVQQHQRVEAQRLQTAQAALAVES